MAAHDQVGDVVGAHLVGIRDRSGVEEGHELGEGLRLAVVGSGRGEDQGVGVGC